MTRLGFAATVIRWQKQYGRQHLPWQYARDPYTVWLSEVMLQQTQVATVLNFYSAFLLQFPTVEALAAAPLDDVLARWSGMGYYSRARNLHRAAQQVVQQFGGEFPKSSQALQALIGVGRSTAAAIAAFCYGERVAILDGNVKRVLSRVLAFDGDLAKTAQVNRLWDLATELLPTQNLGQSMPAYTQGLMDIGATICRVRQPQCLQCPLAPRCQAQRNQSYERYPVNTAKLKRSRREYWLLVGLDSTTDQVWLEQKPMQGLWAGLYGFPMFESEQALRAALPASLCNRVHVRPVFKHVLTHQDLWLHTVHVELSIRTKLTALGRWHSLPQTLQLGLPAPIRKILENLVQTTS